jgi:hypothetical protein
MKRVHALVLTALVATLPVFVPSVAQADEPSAVDAETALQLFKDAKSLREKGDLRSALEKFRAAYALVETPLTALELGRTYIALGQLIEAREALLAVARMPPRKNESAKSVEARAESERFAAELRPRLASVTLRAPMRGASEPPSRVTVDGLLVPAATLGNPRLVNPGKHIIVLEAGSQVVRNEVELREGESRELDLVLPPHPDAPPQASPLVPPPQTSPPPPVPSPSPAAEKPATHDTARKATILAGFGTAAVSVAVGSISGILTLSRAGSLKDACTPDGRCPATSQSDLDSASTLGTVSTVMFGVALVGVAVGTATYVLWKPNPSAVASDSRPGGVRILPCATGIVGTF